MSTQTEHRGLFVAVEGPDGSGKSTQARALTEALRAAGHEVVLTREPGGSDLGETLRELLLDPGHAPVDPRTEALLFAAARSAHAVRTLRPALARGAVVVTDRYVDSSVAYQGAARGLGEARIAALNEWATDGLVPDLTVLLDVDPSEGAGKIAAKDRMEAAGEEFHRRVRQHFLDLADTHPERYLVLNARKRREEIRDAVSKQVSELLDR